MYFFGPATIFFDNSFDPALTGEVLNEINMIGCKFTSNAGVQIYTQEVEQLSFTDCVFRGNGGNPLDSSFLKNPFNINRSGGAIVLNNFLSARAELLIVTVTIASSIFINNVADSYGKSLLHEPCNYTVFFLYLLFYFY